MYRSREELEREARYSRILCHSRPYFPRKGPVVRVRGGGREQELFPLRIDRRAKPFRWGKVQTGSKVALAEAAHPAAVALEVEGGAGPEEASWELV
jgi:hypothetical protein